MPQQCQSLEKKREKKRKKLSVSLCVLNAVFPVGVMAPALHPPFGNSLVTNDYDDDELMLNVLRCQLTY